MAWSLEQARRIALEKKLVEEERMPHFKYFDPTGRTYIEGWAKTTSNRQYQVKVVLPPSYPYEAPELYVISPAVLWKHGNQGSINGLGTSHAFHTLGSGPNGCIRICYSESWDSSKTCVLVLLKAHLWLEAYEAHLRTGRNLAEFLR